MKRCLLKLALFLLLGAIVNVAVAWGCAYLIKFDWRTTSVEGHYDQFVGWWLPRYGNDAKRLGEYKVKRYQGFGSQRVSVFHSYLYDVVPKETTISLEDIIPRWSRGFLYIPKWNNRESKVSTDNAVFERDVLTHTAIIDSRGWPSLSLWGVLRVPNVSPTIYDSDGKPIPLFEKRFWIFTLKTSTPPVFFTDYRCLPLRPIWPGFAINTIFYAAILWLLTLGPLTARRMIRRKRGHCIKCGYDLRGTSEGASGGCPECGWGRLG